MTSAIKTEQLESTEGPVAPIALEDALRRAFGEPYNPESLARYIEAGTRTLYTMEWGPSRQRRVLKVDKRPVKPHAIRHVERGYTTENDLLTLASLPEAASHHINPVLDYRDLRQLGIGVVTAEELFPSRTLRAQIEQEGPMTREQFERFAPQLLDAEQYLIQQGFFNRDLHPENILIHKSRPELRLTDLANAGKEEDMKAKVLPTAGKTSFTPPWLPASIGGKERSYDLNCELHQIGLNLYFMLTGKEIFTVDPENGTASDLHGTSLKREDGSFNGHQLFQSTANAMTQIPAWASRYSHLIRSLIAPLDISSKSDVVPQPQFDSIEEVVKAFETSAKPTVWERVRGLGASLLTGAGLVGALATGYMARQATELDTLRGDYDQKTVVSMVDGRNVEVTNNLVELKVRAHEKDNYREYYPDVPVLRVKPGQIVEVQPELIEMAREERFRKESSLLPGARARVYLEGWGDSTFYVSTSSRTPYYGQAYGGMLSRRLYEIPDLKPGVYALAIEIDPIIGDTTDNVINGLERLKYEHPGYVIARTTIPIVVGDLPEEKTAVLQSIYGTDNARTVLSFRRPGELYGLSNQSNISFEFNIPELGVKELSKDGYGGIRNFPRANPDVVYPVHIITRHADDTVGFRTLPMSMEQFYDRDGNPMTFGDWRKVVPDTGYHSRLEAFRKTLDLENKRR